MKPHHSRMPIVMQRAKELPEQFAEIRTKEAMAQGRYFDREAVPFTVRQVDRTFFIGNGRKITLRLNVVKDKHNPLVSAKAEKAKSGNPDSMPIPPMFPRECHPFTPLTETKSIGQGVPRRKSKGKVYNTDPKRRKRVHAEFQAFHALAQELAYVVRHKDKDSELADRILAVSSDFEVWRTTPKQERVALTRLAIMRSIVFRNAEARKRKPEVTISGEYRRYTLKEKSKKNRQARRQAAAKAKNAPRK